MLYAAKALAMTAVDLFENEELLAGIKEEFAQRTKDGYVCPIPNDEYAKPVEM
jgi:aminobenzoyl-glutamate utilization protein B